MRRRIFIKQMTPAEAGDTKTHEKYIRLPNNFDYQSFFQQEGITNGSVIQVDFEAMYNGNSKDLIPLKFVFYANSNQEKRIPSLGPIFDKYSVLSSDIVILESITNNGQTSFSISFKKEPEVKVFTSPIIYEIEDSENLPIEYLPSLINDKPLQQIYFGAPGTGKSHEIKDQIKKHKSFRITFHPDTDYSSFVGAYKPTSVEVPMLTPLGDKAIPMKDVDGNELTENKIIYTYVKQAFLNAYIEAWKERANENPHPVFLVIEEINRGNCAQIFGDIFQLLDRNDAGFSDYAIVPDTDLSRHVKKDLEKLVIADREKINGIYEECEADMVDKVLKGEVLLLPNNLYIWATMNTSDQSLFPIDSAFKRRWDWKYIKIANAQKNWQIKVGTNSYDWWQFVQAINYFVFDATQSEDKNLGYFFAKAKNGIINAETFVSKVIFYLYTDVFKDYGFSGDIFKGVNDDEMTFQSFYNADGSPCESQIIRFIENVMFSDALPESLKATAVVDDEDVSVYEEDEAVGNRTTSNRDKYMVNGVGSYGKCRAPFEAVKTYASINPQMTASEIAEKWTNLNVNHLPHLVETEQQFEQRAVDSTDTKFRDKAKQLVLANGEIVYVSNQFNPVRINELISKLATADLGVNISLIEA
jgi:hypothetical protein